MRIAHPGGDAGRCSATPRLRRADSSSPRDSSRRPRRSARGEAIRSRRRRAPRAARRGGGGATPRPAGRLGPARARPVLLATFLVTLLVTLLVTFLVAFLASAVRR